jgi:hypothetical protein
MGGKKKEAKEKPLEKMTAKELREIALQIPEITGVHGFNKDELVSIIKQFRGIKEDAKKSDTTVREVKAKIRGLKCQRETFLEESNEKMAAIFRRRIIRLKKKTRRAA